MSSDQESCRDDDESSEYLNNEIIVLLNESSSEQEFCDEDNTDSNTITITTPSAVSEIDNSENDNDSSSYYSEGDDSEITSDCYYEPEEISRTKYNIVLCELYNIKKHGYPSTNIVENNYLTVVRFKKLNMSLIECETWNWYNYNMSQISHFTPHNIFRNYEYILRREDLIRPEIAECIYLSGGECVSILKTFWIRIIQRKWKKILVERKEKLKLRKQIKSLIYRETIGKWPSSCLYLPSLKGMLSELG
jgi:hypothetical protein